MAYSREGFEECLENVICTLEGKGFKIRLKSSTKGKTCWQYIFKCELLIKEQNEKYQ